MIEQAEPTAQETLSSNALGGIRRIKNELIELRTRLGAVADRVLPPAEIYHSENLKEMMTGGKEKPPFFETLANDLTAIRQELMLLQQLIGRLDREF